MSSEPSVELILVSKPSAISCYPDSEPKVSKGFEIAEKYSGSDIQCKERCKNRADCAAYAYDTALCFFMLFGTERGGLLRSSVEHQSIDPFIKETVEIEVLQFSRL